MNSFRCLRKLQTNAAAAAILAALALPAHAQQAPAPAPAELTLPGADEKAPPPPVALPKGASIDGAQDKVRGLAAEAGKSLEDLVGSAMTPRSKAEVGELANRQRRLMDLEYQLKEAKLAKQLWVEINGDDSKEKDSEISRLQGEKESLQAEIIRLTSMQMQSTARTADPDPVVAEITGAGGSMRAKVLVPYSGEFMVERGTVLPNGMKVVSVGKDGVTVMSGDVRKPLAFGSAVPRSRPSAAPMAAAAPVPGSGANIIRQIGQ